jgi:hypothetical protein
MLMRSTNGTLQDCKFSVRVDEFADNILGKALPLIFTGSVYVEFVEVEVSF